MKKKLVTILICCSLALVLAACGQDESVKKNTDSVETETASGDSTTTAAESTEKESTTKTTSSTTKATTAATSTTTKATTATTATTTTKATTTETTTLNAVQVEARQYVPQDGEVALIASEGRYYRAAIDMQIVSETATTATVVLNGGIQMKNIDGWHGGTVTIGDQTISGDCNCTWSPDWTNSSLYLYGITFTVDKTDAPQTISHTCVASVGGIGTSTATASVVIPAK